MTRVTGMELCDSHENAIAASWDRCERQHNLLPDTSNPILRLQSAEVAPRCEEMVERTGGRRGIIRHLAEIANTAGQCLVVSDADGILVRLECDDRVRSEFEQYGIALGSCWDERIGGTNGVAMAMSQGNTFTVRGNEHFFAKLRPFTCTAAPLIDAEHQLFGAINLATVDRGNSADYVFAQQLLTATARKIQRILFEQRFRGTRMVSISSYGKDALAFSTELVAVDETGIILGATAEAHRLVGLIDSTQLVGKSFAVLFGADTEAIESDPGRYVSNTINAGSVLFAAEWSNVTDYPGRGWQPSSAKRKPKRIRRRLAPTLRQLAIGSESFAAIIERAHHYFERALPFVVEGESGTGKSALIESLHRTAKQSQSQLVTIDCALLDRKADERNYIGTILDRARAIDALDDTDRDGATLVLDNVDELPGYGQAALRSLLTTLEATGSSLDEDEPASALRVVATSRKPLKDAVEAGRFRDDLYFLLSNARFEIPPLRQRERPEALARALAVHLAVSGVEITEEAIDEIRRHTWPGNVRELRNTLRQALLEGNGRRISLTDLQASSAFRVSDSRTLPTSFGREARPVQAFDEKGMIEEALLGARWNVSRAARNLGIGRATIHRKMKLHGIKRPEKPGR